MLIIIEKEDFTLQNTVETIERSGSQPTCECCEQLIKDVFFYRSDIPSEKFYYKNKWWCEECYNSYFNINSDTINMDNRIKENKLNLVIDLELLLNKPFNTKNKKLIL